MISPGRMGAARALVAIEDGEFSDVALEEFLAGEKDQDLGWFLCLGVLQRRGEVDAALRPFLKQPLEGLEPEVRAVLRLGTFEKLYARTQEHAAVHQAVEVIKRLGKRRAQGLVNALLRRVQPILELAPADAANLPPWLYDRWARRYGAEATAAWAQSLCEPAPMTVVCTDPQLPARWEAEGLQVRPARARSATPAQCYTVAGLRGPITRIAGWDQGAVWVQDAAAVAVADLCGAGEGTTVLDACAAPGGKTLRLASAGAKVTAVDRSDARLERVRENLTRTRMTAEVRTHDWTRGPMGTESFQVVLVDAPCSALGTARRSPEVKWRRQEVDLAASGERQLQILQSASKHVAPGGVLVYAVCSPEPEEGKSVIAAFTKGSTGFRVDAQLLTAPPVDGEDSHQAFRLVLEGAGA